MIPEPLRRPYDSTSTNERYPGDHASGGMTVPFGPNTMALAFRIGSTFNFPQSVLDATTRPRRDVRRRTTSAHA
jgi:hypothetical protein